MGKQAFGAEAAAGRKGAEPVGRKGGSTPGPTAFGPCRRLGREAFVPTRGRDAIPRRPPNLKRMSQGRVVGPEGCL